MVAAWWAGWDSAGTSAAIQKLDGVRSASLIAPLVFLPPPVIASVLVKSVVFRHDRTFLGERWRTADLVRLTIWSTVAPTGSQLLAALGFESLYQRNGWGTVWLLSEVIMLLAGAIGLRSAEGLRMRKVKSGEVYKRAVVLGKQVGVKLSAVEVVPVGRGNLVNAYGSAARTIAITENYTAFLRGAQLDFVIGHELEHVKQRHGIKELAFMAAIFCALAVGCLFLPFRFLALRPLLDIVIVMVPVLIRRAISRRLEFRCDRAGLMLTRNPDAARRALTNLYEMTQVPPSRGWLIELFMSHPSLDRRLRALERSAVP